MKMMRRKWRNKGKKKCHRYRLKSLENLKNMFSEKLKIFLISAGTIWEMMGFKR